MEKQPEMTPFAAALQHHLKKKWGAASALSRAISLSSGYISELSSGVKRGDEDKRRLVAKALGYAYDDFLAFGQHLIDGNDPATWSPTTREPPSVGPLPERQNRRLRAIPLISWVQAGDWLAIEDPFHPGDADEWITTTATTHENAFALVVRGDSMAPLFLAGETIIVDPGRDAVSGDYIIAKNGEQEATFKQLVVDGANTYLKPLNERYPIKDMTGREFCVVGVVVAKEMRF